MHVGFFLHVRLKGRCEIVLGFFFAFVEVLSNFVISTRELNLKPAF